MANNKLIKTKVPAIALIYLFIIILIFFVLKCVSLFISYKNLTVYYILRSIGTTTACIGLFVSRLSLNCATLLKNTSILSSVVNEKNMLLSAPLFTEGNQLEFILKEETSL